MSKLKGERITTMNGIPFRDTNLKNNVLEKDNNDEYMPEADYNPATKKYVDESTSTILNNIINDDITSSTTTYSSKKIDDMFGDLQRILDELNSGKN